MILIESLFGAFINIVLCVLSDAEWLCVFLVSAFGLAFVAVLVYKVITDLGVIG